MKGWVLAAAAVFGTSGPASAGPLDAAVAEAFTSFYVLGDSLSDDGNLPGFAWLIATGGAPYRGSLFGGGVFTNGEVWNEPLLEAFDDAGRDADNFAVAGSRASGGVFLPDLDRQIDRLLGTTSAEDRGSNPLVSIWSGANDLLDAIGSGDVRRAARSAADAVAVGARRLFDEAGVDDFVVPNVPNLAKTPRYNLFDRTERREAKVATRVYNRRLARRLAELEEDALNVYEVDAFGLLEEARRDPEAFGLVDVTLPCVFSSAAEARAFGQPLRCDVETAEGRLFIDEVHPNARAHEVLGELAAEAILLDGGGPVVLAASARAGAPAPVPLPGGAPLLAGALAAFVLAGRRVHRQWA